MWYRNLILLVLMCLGCMQAFGSWPESSQENLPISTVIHTGQSVNPHVVEAGDDSWIVVWSGDSLLGLYDAKQGVFARKVDSSGNSPWGNGAVVKSATGEVQNVQAAPDGEGGVLVTWLEMTSSSGLKYTVYAQRVDSEGNRRWQPEGVSIASATLTLAEPHIISESSGGAYVTWQGSPTGSQKSKMHLFSQRVNSKGEALWKKGGVVLCDQEKCSQVSLAKDSRGGFVAVWAYAANSRYGVMGQSVTSEGEARWQTMGLPLNTPGNLVYTNDLLPMSGGTVVFAWSETP